MLRVLLLLVAAGLALLWAAFLREHHPVLAGVKFERLLGKSGPTSIHSELPSLALQLVFEEERRRILSRQEDGKIYAWDLASGAKRLVAETEQLFAYCPARQLLMVRRDETVGLIDLGGRPERQIAEGAYDHGAWSRDCGRFVLAGEERQEVEIWQTEPLAKQATLETAMPVRNGLVLSDDGLRLATAGGTYDSGRGHKTRLEIFRLEADGKARRTARFDTPILGMWKMVFAPLGSKRAPAQLFVGSQTAARSGLRGIAADTGAVAWRQDGFRSYWVRALALSPDGTLLVSGDEKGLLRGWDARTGDPLFRKQTGMVIQDLAFSEDGAKLAVALKDSTIGIVAVQGLTE